MRLYRVGPEKYLENYKGLGASYQDGGRWNKPGHPVIYFAASPAVALLEMGNYISKPRLVPKTYGIGVYEYAEPLSIEDVDINTLPDEWADYPYPIVTQEIGSAWLEEKRSLLLRVPSVTVAGGLEDCFVCNPLQEGIGSIKLVSRIDKIYNECLFSTN